MVLQYEPKDIILCLNKLSKNKEIPREVQDYIIANTKNFGTARLFLDEQNYYLDIDSYVWNDVLEKNPHIRNMVSSIEFNLDSIIN